ncbi:transmembrane protein, putative [Bodo saltans]|uniref:Transmembrane protein, putative n=1 Tax=Bodo saltans TaxID=75058 RepID=A0A0S4J845_BODSA|nr:transmembrane protein, putative [Bodo saltans]|eukprot:CUG86251.1 transmembrane protein, putative [Bodo saltans]
MVDDQRTTEDGDDDAAARKRNRLSFYLNRRSAGAAAYWQKKQQREQQEAQLQAEALRDMEPTAQNYRSAAQQALVAAMDVNKETLQSIQHMEHVMNETEAIGVESAVILRQGQENLEVLDNTLVHMEPVLKRAKKDLIQFFRRMMRDKICVCLVFFVLALVLAVIITSQLEGKATVPFNIQLPGNLSGI